MRTDRLVAALSLVLVLGACGRREEPTVSLSDDLRRDLATAAVPGGDLATAPRTYERMRFVSGVERAAAAQPARRGVVTHVARPAANTRRAAPHHVAHPAEATAPEPTAATLEVASAPTPVPASEAPLPEPVVISQRPRPDYIPAGMPAGSGEGDAGMGERRRGGGIGGLGGILGGILTGAVIRGGHGGVDKCDPRTDGRNRPTIVDRPDFGMPLPTGRTTFPGRGL